MKKILLSLLFIGNLSFSQDLITENFDSLGDPFVLPAEWTVTNQSSPIGTIDWFRGGGGTTFGAFNGGQNGYIGANFNNTAGTGVISNWLMSPVVNLVDGDVITFYTRTATGTQWADNLELRISTQGASSTNPVGATGVGSYTTLALTVNPTFPSAAGYPQDWTQFSYTVTGVPTETPSRIAFRYTVPTSAGPSGNNSNYIGIDAFNVNRTLSTQDFFANNLKVYPNPTKDILNLSSSTTLINNVEVTDLNGRIVKSFNLNGIAQTVLNVSDLTSGMYFVSVETDLGKGTTKIVKN